MAELGVASGVIGIVSFGVQITQGLLTYYGSWKDQDNNVLDMCASLDGLSRTLTLLLKTIQQHATPGGPIEKSVEENVNRVDEAMKKLEDELRKVQATESPKPGVRAAMRRHVRRALYPFKENTLRKIQQVVSEARSNLDIALQVLQVFVYLEFIGVVLQWLT
jgi:ankyrin repeat domain-containing protein 50